MKRNQEWGARAVRGAVIGGLLALVPAPGRAAEAFAHESLVPERPSLMPTQLTCLGTGRFVYAPAMSSTPQEVAVTYTGYYGGCLAVGGGQGAGSVRITTSTRVFPGVACGEVLSSAPEVLTFVWSNGMTSVVSLAPAEVDVEVTTTTVTFTGTVVEGRFKGMSVARASTYANTDLSARCQSDVGLGDANVFSILAMTRTN